LIIVNNLETAQKYIAQALTDIKENPEQDALVNLLDAIQALEWHYQDFCEGCDVEFDEEKGTTYRKGISLEFYIESSLWHDVSKAFRLIRKQETNDE